MKISKPSLIDVMGWFVGILGVAASILSAFANEIPTSLPANGGNADTVDGEHASNFVRAGNFESANLNSLDTYSFIKSVNSNVASASPNGNTGWYNVI